MALRGATRTGLIEQSESGRNRHARWRTLLAGLTVAGLGLGLSACSWSWQLGSFSALAGGGDDEVPTGSIKPRDASPLSPVLGQEDWRRAKSAMAVALDIQGNGKPASWDNPDSGIKGIFAPLGAPFVQTDDICRAFSAGISGKTPEQKLEGLACRTGPDEWAIKDVKPVKKSV